MLLPSLPETGAEPTWVPVVVPEARFYPRSRDTRKERVWTPPVNGGGALGALLLRRWISWGRADNGCSRVFVLWWTGFWGVLDIMRVAGAEPIVPG